MRGQRPPNDNGRPPRRREYDDRQTPRRNREYDEIPPRRREYDDRQPRRSREYDDRPPRRKEYDDRYPRNSKEYDDRPPRRNREYDDRPPRRRNPNETRGNGPKPKPKPKKLTFIKFVKQQLTLIPALGRNVGIVAVGIVAIIAIIIFIRQLTLDNSLAVYLDNNLIGHIELVADANIGELEADLINNARNTLEGSLNSDVNIMESSIRLEPTRVNSRDIMLRTDLTIEIINRLRYELMAAAIYVDGERHALFRTTHDANQVLETLKERYKNERTVESYFNRVVNIIPVPYSEDLLVNEISETVVRLRQPTRTMTNHTIQPGESLHIIANMHNTSVDQILELNADVITNPDNVQSGTVIRVESNEDFLLVYTVEEFVETVIEPPEYVDTPTSALPEGQIVIVHPGSPSEVQVKIKRTFLNGVQVGEDELSDRNVIIQGSSGARNIGTGPANSSE